MEIAEKSLVSSYGNLTHFNQNADKLYALPHWILTARQLCDLELLLNGGFAPLTGFMNKSDYESVRDNMRLVNGKLWPIPIVLDVDLQFAEKISKQREIVLCDTEGLLLAVLAIEEIWEVDKEKEAKNVYGTSDRFHPGVAYLYDQVKDVYLGGKLSQISLPHYYDFQHLRHTPAQLRQIFKQLGWEKVVAFQTRNPMHQAHQVLTLRAAQKVGHLLIHPVVGVTKPGDIEYDTRVRCYEYILKTYPPGLAYLSLLPLAMRMAGPREALWHAMIRKNYGCTHFIVGRDHAGPGKNREGKDFYEIYAAQQLVLQYQHEVGIEIIPFKEMVYSKKSACYYSIDEFPTDETPMTVSGTELRNRLQNNQEIPEWFSYPAVIKELRKATPPKWEQGITIFFTGLPCSGKTTLANGLAIKLRELTSRQITLLDGDVIRKNLSRGLGFSAQDRELNILRVGFVAKEITRHRGITICALVSPYQKSRDDVRKMIEEVGGFIEVYVATPISICEQRDRKGLYQLARKKIIENFTGIDDPYETPQKPEVVINTQDQTPEELIRLIIEKMISLGYIRQ